MEILQNIFKAGLASSIMQELVEQDIRVYISCTDKTDVKIYLTCIDVDGFLSVDGGIWRAHNQDILASSMVVDLAGSGANGIALKGCALRITQDEFKFFDIECVVVG